CTAARCLLPGRARAYTATPAWGGEGNAVAVEPDLAFAIAGATLLAVICIVSGLRLRKARLALDALREHERSARMALWASGQRYWELDVATTGLRYLVARPGPGDNAREALGAEHADPASVIHPDDLPAVVDAMHRYVAGETPEFCSEHRVRVDGTLSSRGDWIWV